MQYLKFFQVVTVVFILTPNLLWATENTVPSSENLQLIGQQAQQSKRPVMLVFAAKDCGYCDRLEADHLGPMTISHEYDSRVIIRKVMIDSYDDIKDFDGDDRSAEDLADKYGVTVTPTVMMFDNSGNRLTKKLIGYNGNEYFGWDLEQLIAKAEVAIAK